MNGATSNASRVDFSRFFKDAKLGWGYPSAIDLTDKCSQSWETNMDGTRSLFVTFEPGNRPHISKITKNGKRFDIHQSLRVSHAYCTQHRYPDPFEPEWLPSLLHKAGSIEGVLNGGLAVRTLRINMKDGAEQTSVLSQGLQYAKTWLSGPESMQTTNVASVIFEGDYVERAQKSDADDVRV